MKLSNITLISVLLTGNHEDTDIDLGSISLKLEDRDFVLDVTNSYRTYDEDDKTTAIVIDVEVDKTIFPDNNYNLTAEDLLNDNLEAEIYLNLEEMEDFQYAMLSVNVNGEDKDILLKLEE